MHIKSILAGAAIALVAGVGSASAAEDFYTTAAVPAEPMTPADLGAVAGLAIRITTPDGTNRLGGGNGPVGGGIVTSPAPVIELSTPGSEISIAP